MRRLIRVLVLQLLGLSLLFPVFDAHAVRAALFSVKETADRGDLEWPPDQAPEWYRSDPVSLYWEFRDDALATIRGSESEWEADLALMQHVRTLGGNGPIIRSDSISKIRDFLRQGKSANCAHYSWLLMAYLRSIGREARAWGLDEKDGLGGNGHAVVEVWLDSRKKWVLLDPFNNAFFTREDIPLSLFEIRDALLGQPGSLQVHQESPFEMPASKLPGYYTRHILNISLDGAGNLISRNQNRFGPLGFARAFIRKLPRYPKRAIACLFGKGDLRVHYLDGFSAPYHAGRYKLLFWVFIAGGLGAAVTCCWISREAFASRGKR